jgi:MFS transporter, DHA2 family, multidrug resistance protein
MSTTTEAKQQPLEGLMLILAAIIVAGSNFIAVLDMTIANVSVSTISGSLGTSLSQGTWIITSYAVAEAITVPLTGWLATRFGVVRTFCVSMVMFAVMSLACGLAPSFGFLVAARVMQGVFGGPLMPLSQSLLMQIFPKEKEAAANGIWGVTTLIAPVLGPILGGYICADYHWGWVFLINVPLALGGGIVAYMMLKRYEQPVKQLPIDVVGLVLLIVWVAALQIFLDKGKDLDWFESQTVIALAITSAVVFGVFVIWEYYAEHPVVDIKVFQHRGFLVSAVTLFLGFAALFAANVLTPLWLQNYMGYTSFESGKTAAWAGVLAVCTAPVVAVLATRHDPRKLVFIGLTWLSLISIYRSFATTEMDSWSIVLPIFGLGLGMPMFFVPLMSIALGNVELEEVASAAGLLSFIRTLAGAIGTSVVTTEWEDRATAIHAYLVGMTDKDGFMFREFQNFGFSSDATLQNMNNLLQVQSIMLSTNQLMFITGLIYCLAALMVWLAPKPEAIVDTSSVH